MQLDLQVVFFDVFFETFLRRKFCRRFADFAAYDRLQLFALAVGVVEMAQMFSQSRFGGELSGTKRARQMGNRARFMDYFQFFRFFLQFFQPISILQAVVFGRLRFSRRTFSVVENF